MNNGSVPPKCFARRGALRFSPPTSAVRKLFSVVLLLAGIVLPLVGCSRGNPQPEAQVTTVIGLSAPCAACGKTVSDISESNTFEHEGIQYVVCDEKCAEEIREWIASMDER